MAETKIIIVKPGTINSKDKEKLSKHGHVVVEHPWPDTVRILQNDSFDLSVVLQSALEAIRDNDGIRSVKKDFGGNLAKLLTEKK